MVSVLYFHKYISWVFNKFTNNRKRLKDQNPYVVGLSDRYRKRMGCS